MSGKTENLTKEISLNREGIHSGINVTITFKPAPANNGFKSAGQICVQPVIECSCRKCDRYLKGNNFDTI